MKASDLNASALAEPFPRPLFRAETTFTPLNHDAELASATKIPQAPPMPAAFTERLSSETLKSTDFNKGIKSRTSSLTPSGTDLSQSMLIRPSCITDPPPIIQMAKPKTYSNPITKPTLRNRRRTPLTPDVLALTKLRRPEHIKSSIVQRIEELRQASSLHTHPADEKPTLSPLAAAAAGDVLITCAYQNNDQERAWLTAQAQLHSSVQLNDRRFQLRAVEFVDKSNVRFYAQDNWSDANLSSITLKQISAVTILILSILRLIENGLSNLAIPGMHIVLNLIYVLVLILVAMLLLANQQ